MSLEERFHQHACDMSLPTEDAASLICGLDVDEQLQACLNVMRHMLIPKPLSQTDDPVLINSEKYIEKILLQLQVTKLCMNIQKYFFIHIFPFQFSPDDVIILYTKAGRYDLAVSWFRRFGSNAISPDEPDFVATVENLENDPVFSAFVSMILERKSQNIPTDGLEKDLE